MTERLYSQPSEERKIVAQTMYMPSIPVKKSSNKDSDRKRFLRVQNNVRQTAPREETEDERWLL